MPRWTLPSRAKPDRGILSDSWTTSTCYKAREIERRTFGEAALRGTSGIYLCAELFYRILLTLPMNAHCWPAWHVPRVACGVPMLQEKSAFVLPPILTF